MPKACRGRGPDWADPYVCLYSNVIATNAASSSNIGHNDVMANFSLTLVDNLDSFVALNNHSGFDWAVRQTLDVVSFDQDAKPQVRQGFRLLLEFLSHDIRSLKLPSVAWEHCYLPTCLRLIQPENGDSDYPGIETSCFTWHTTWGSDFFQPLTLLLAYPLLE
jgi:hypothetical protein